MIMSWRLRSVNSIVVRAFDERDTSSKRFREEDFRRLNFSFKMPICTNGSMMFPTFMIGLYTKETNCSEDRCAIKIRAALIDSTNYSGERDWKAQR